MVVVDKVHAKGAELEGSDLSILYLKSEGASLSESTWETRRKSTGGSSSSTKVTPVASAAAISNHSASEFTLNIRLRHI